MNPQFEAVLKNKKIKDALLEVSGKDRWSLKGYAIARAVKKKKYKKVNGAWL